MFWDSWPHLSPPPPLAAQLSCLVLMVLPNIEVDCGGRAINCRWDDIGSAVLALRVRRISHGTAVFHRLGARGGNVNIGRVPRRRLAPGQFISPSWLAAPRIEARFRDEDGEARMQPSQFPSLLAVLWGLKGHVPGPGDTSAGACNLGYIVGNPDAMFGMSTVAGQHCKHVYPCKSR